MNLTCGSFCVNYILKNLGKETILVNPKMYWITELALFLNEHIPNKINLYYYNSNLMKDYLDYNNKVFEGFNYIKKVINSPEINFAEKMLTPSEYSKEINNSVFIILCVESKILNNIDNMDGGHYIILKEINKNKVLMYNPQRNRMKIEIIDYKKIMKLCKNYGSWRIVIEKEV